MVEPVRISASYSMRCTVTLPKTGETLDVHSYMQKPWDFQFFQRWSVLIKLTKENELVCRLETMGGKGCFCTPAFAKKGWHWFGAWCKGEACLGKKDPVKFTVVQKPACCECFPSWSQYEFLDVSVMMCKPPVPTVQTANPTSNGGGRPRNIIPQELVRPRESNLG